MTMAIRLVGTPVLIIPTGLARSDKRRNEGQIMA